MKHTLKTLSAALCLALSCSTAQSQPYCHALLDADALDKKYKGLAPIFSSQETGWIFTRDQLSETYAMKPAAEALLRQIVAEFQAAGVTLAILVAPPRPVIAGQATVNATLAGNGGFDVEKAETSFRMMIKQIKAAGAVAPNLLDVAKSADGFYFKRDTHWTNSGAARSISALSAMLDDDAVALLPETLPQLENASERGSLSDIIEANCGFRDAAETTKIFNYASLRTSEDLLGDTSDIKPIALLGTSFSNRYKRDSYQVADALATALDADVANFSASGGGMIGAIEAYVMSGALAARANDVVIWEFPYTESLNSTSALRQLLGALRMSRAGTTAGVLDLDTNAKVEFLVASDVNPDLLVLRDLPKGFRQVHVDVLFEDGAKKTIKLRRKSNVSALDVIAADLSGFPKSTIKTIRLRFNSDLAGQPVTFSLGS